MTDRHPFVTSHKRVIFVIALAVGATVAAVLLIGQAAHFGSLLKRVRHASAGWLVVCALGEALAYVGYLILYRAIAQFEDGPRIPRGLALRIVGLSFGAFSLATAVGGLSVDTWALHEAGEPIGRASARVIAFETMRWAVLALATCVAGIFVLIDLAHPVPWPVPVAWLVIVPLCFAGGLWVSAPRRAERFTRASSSRRLLQALGVAVGALGYLRRLMTGPAGLRRRAISGAAIYWAGDALCAWAGLRSFGADLGPAALLLGYTTGQVSEALPLPGGGSGGVDAAMTGGFVLAGAPLSVALLGAITFRIFNFWLPALVAIPALITVRGLRDRLHQVAELRQRS